MREHLDLAFRGGAIEGVGNLASGLDLPGAARSFSASLQAHESMGINNWQSAVLQLNPVAWVMEGRDGRSYQAGDFGRELSNEEIALRVTQGVLGTAMTALGPVGSARMLLGGTIGTTTVGQAAGIANRRLQAGVSAASRVRVSVDMRSVYTSMAGELQRFRVHLRDAEAPVKASCNPPCCPHI